MAVLSTNATTEFALSRWIRNAVDAVRVSLRRKAEFNRVYAELNALSFRELEDIGIARADILEIARESASRV
ncbi:MAG: DUF1127 domain-containing protein [Rhodobacteraceae bacterium]|nr:DUF1127 domain-containing protein [Paracoccaceae bacterium]